MVDEQVQVKEARLVDDDWQHQGLDVVQEVRLEEEDWQHQGLDVVQEHQGLHVQMLQAPPPAGIVRINLKRSMLIFFQMKPVYMYHSLM